MADLDDLELLAREVRDHCAAAVSPDHSLDDVIAAADARRELSQKCTAHSVLELVERVRRAEAELKALRERVEDECARSMTGTFLKCDGGGSFDGDWVEACDVLAALEAKP